MFIGRTNFAVTVAVGTKFLGKTDNFGVIYTKKKRKKKWVVT